MHIHKSLLHRLQHSDNLLRNTRWMLVSEGLARASRLITVIVLAACLSSTDYGIVMLAIVFHELLRVLTRTGSGAKIIQCSDGELSAYAGNAITLNWLISLSLGALQYTLAPAIASFYDSPSIEPLLQLMALTYVIYPLVTVRVYLLQRSNNMKYYGLCSALAVMTDNFSTALLAALDFGVYCVAIAKILAALVWVGAFFLPKISCVKASFSIAIMKQLLSFSCKVLSSELLKTLRTQLDVLLAAKLLAPEAFGLYSFAKSAGVGLGQSLSNAYLACIYPRLAQQHREQALHGRLPQVFMIALAISGIFVLQSLLAPVYIPLIFGSDRIEAASLVMLLCLTAIPALMVDISALILRVKNKMMQEVKLQALAVLSLFIVLMITTPNSPQMFALVLVFSSAGWILLLPFFLLAPTNPLLFWRTKRCQ